MYQTNNFEIELKDNYDDIKNTKELEDNTTVIKIEGTNRFIIQDF